MLGYTHEASDRRLKRRLQRVAGVPPLAPGLHLYAFEWNARARRAYGLRGRAVGLVADEVRRVCPAAVCRDRRTGYDRVDVAAVVRRLNPRRKRQR